MTAIARDRAIDLCLFFLSGCFLRPNRQTPLYLFYVQLLYLFIWVYTVILTGMFLMMTFYLQKSNQRGGGTINVSQTSGRMSSARSNRSTHRGSSPLGGIRGNVQKRRRKVDKSPEYPVRLLMNGGSPKTKPSQTEVSMPFHILTMTKNC